MLAYLPNTTGESLPVPKLSAMFIRLDKFSTQASSPNSLCRSKNESSDATFSHYRNESSQHTTLAALAYFDKGFLLLFVIWLGRASMRDHGELL